MLSSILAGTKGEKMYLIIENKPHEAIRFVGYIKSKALMEKYLKDHKKCSSYEIKPIFEDEKEEEWDLR